MARRRDGTSSRRHVVATSGRVQADTDRVYPVPCDLLTARRRDEGTRRAGWRGACLCAWLGGGQGPGARSERLGPGARGQGPWARGQRPKPLVLGRGGLSRGAALSRAIGLTRAGAMGKRCTGMEGAGCWLQEAAGLLQRAQAQAGREAICFTAGMGVAVRSTRREAQRERERESERARAPERKRVERKRRWHWAPAAMVRLPRHRERAPVATPWH